MELGESVIQYFVIKTMGFHIVWTNLELGFFTVLEILCYNIEMNEVNYAETTKTS